MKRVLTASSLGLALLFAGHLSALSVGQNKSHSVESKATTTQSAPLSINKATIDDLKKLPGIGPTLAQRIVDDREKKGRFKSLNDLLQVRGMSQHKLDKLNDRVSL